LKIVAVSMRVDEYRPYSETRDSLDHRWTKFLDCVGLVPFLVPNVLSYRAYQYLASEVNLCGLILTGGNDLGSINDGVNVSLERDTTEKKLIEHCIDHQLPIVGVCRGMQILVEYFGGNLSKVENHVRKNHIIEFVDPKIRSLETNSFHSFAPDRGSLPEALEVVANSQDGEIEAISHNFLPIKGIMWHPERYSKFHRFDLNLFEQAFNL